MPSGYKNHLIVSGLQGSGNFFHFLFDFSYVATHQVTVFKTGQASTDPRHLSAKRKEKSITAAFIAKGNFFFFFFFTILYKSCHKKQITAYGREVSLHGFLPDGVFWESGI